MLFSSPVFLFLFLPALLACYFIAPRPVKNLLLLAASLVFYAWGEMVLVLVMLGSIGVNYSLALLIGRYAGRPAACFWLATAVVANLGCLAVFKYAPFLAENLNLLLAAARLPLVEPPRLTMPVGISFYTFQALSYVIDVYRRETRAERNLVHVALYITLFPQLIAGPIVRYVDIAEQMRTRRMTFDGFAAGVQRFIVGLGKKMLIANSCGAVADIVFQIPDSGLGAPLAWLGVVCYALQIYYDFSGYSDMAIGLGRMFGFEFLENFNYPYVAVSVQDFWRRWHISLSTWFRDYLYIPLGGSRCEPWKARRNLLIVFLLCGLWHGASWNFAVWGLFHGAFLALERGWLGGFIGRRPAIFRHAYTLLVVLIGWVIFRADSLGHAATFLSAMAGLQGWGSAEFHVGLYLDSGLMLVLAAGMLGAVPWLGWLQARIATLQHEQRETAAGNLLGALRVAALGAVLVASSSVMLAGTYNPFIYFRF